MDLLTAAHGREPVGSLRRRAGQVAAVSISRLRRDVWRDGHRKGRENPGAILTTPRLKPGRNAPSVRRDQGQLCLASIDESDRLAIKESVLLGSEINPLAAPIRDLAERRQFD